MSGVRQAALSGVLALSLLGLTACGSGSSDAGGEGSATLSSITVEGEQGKAPEVTFDGRLDATLTETETLIEGDGEDVAEGDTVEAHWWIGNGFTEKETQSTYDGEPQSVELGDEVLPFLNDTMVGHKVGDRVVALMPSDTAFGEGGGARFNIGNRDAAVIVVDIMGRKDTIAPLDGPQGEEKTPASWAPTLIEKDGVITGLDFTNAHEPTGKLIATTLVKGDGAVVKKGQTLTVELSRPGVRRGRAVRRVLQHGAGGVPDRHRQRHHGLGRAARRAHRGLARDPRDPAGRRLRRGGQRGRRHQGHRHAVLRGRHPRRQLSRTGQTA